MKALFSVAPDVLCLIICELKNVPLSKPKLQHQVRHYIVVVFQFLLDVKEHWEHWYCSASRCQTSLLSEAETGRRTDTAHFSHLYPCPFFQVTTLNW